MSKYQGPRRFARALFYLLIMIFYVPAMQAQDFRALHYTVDEGLPSNVVYNAFKDHQGFMWISTNQGISRYNGIKFETFTTFDGLSDNENFFVKEDYNGRLWVAAYNGQLCYRKDGKLFNATNTPFLKLPFTPLHINSISIDFDSSITFNFDDAKMMVNIKGNVARTYDLSHLKDPTIIPSIISKYKIAPGIFQLVTRTSLVQIDTLMRVVKVTPTGQHEKADHVMFNGTLAIIDANNIYDKYYYKIRSLPQGFRDNHTIQSLFKDDRDNFFICTNKGLFINDSIHVFEKESITSINQDLNGNFIMTTHDDGIFIFQHNFFQSKELKSIYTGVIKNVHIDKDHIFYVSTGDGLCRLSNDQRQLCFKMENSTSPKLTPTNESAYIIDHDHRFFNFSNGYIGMMDNVTQNSPKIVVRKDQEIMQSIKATFSTPDAVYLKLRENVVYFDPSKFNSSSFPVNFVLDKSAIDTADRNRIFGMAVDKDHHVWYTTVKKVFKLVNNKSVAQNQFGDISFKRFDFLNDLMVGYTYENKLLICYDIDNNLKVDSVKPMNCIWDKLYKIDSCHLLISTNNLYRLLTVKKGDPKNRYSINTLDNPFIPLQAESIGADSSNCYFFKGGSIIKMSIDNLLQRSSPPQLFFNLLKFGNQPLLIREVMKLPFSGSKNISISYLTLSYGGKNLAYQYSISKSENENNWLPIKGDEINLVSPGFGTYYIKLRAKTISSEFSKPIEFTLVIAPPFWATFWFIGLCVIALTALIWWIVHIRITRELHKKEKEHETEIKFMKSEYKAMNALMNPHFIFNTLNNVQGLVNRNDKLAANEYLRIFADLVRQNMHNVSKELIPLQKEITLVGNYLSLEKLRFKDLLNYKINIDENVDISSVMVPPLLIQPLIENSIKHGILPRQSPESMIILNVYEKDDVLNIEVKDNGVGLNWAKKKVDPNHESFGLSNIKSRITQLGIIMNKNIEFKMYEVQEETGQWTVVSITIPN